MKTKPSVGDRVSFYHTGPQERIRGTVTSVDGQLCSIRADDGYNYRVSMFELRRLRKVPSKDKQRIAELEEQLNLSKEINRKLANHNADLSAENDVLKWVKPWVKPRELLYVGHDSDVACDIERRLFRDKSGVRKMWTYISTLALISTEEVKK